MTESNGKATSLLGDRPFLIEVSDIEACDINTAGDFLLADALYQTLNKRS